MFKNMMVRFANGFCYSIAITTLVNMVIMFATNGVNMLPEYMERFTNPVVALCVQLVLIGIMSGITSAGTVIMEMKKTGLAVQSVIYFILMAIVWIPISCYLWSFHKYITSMISTVASMLVTYGICWIIQYNICKNDIVEINKKLQTNDNAA